MKKEYSEPELDIIELMKGGILLAGDDADDSAFGGTETGEEGNTEF